MNIVIIVASQCGETTNCCYNACGSAPKGSFSRLLCYVFMAVVASLLLCSGDVETNPGPPECESVVINLKSD